MYVVELLRMVVNPAPGTPEDARTVARQTLSGLDTQLARALGSTRLDEYTRAHFADSRTRIAHALTAQVVVPSTQVR